jgi:hypothetical protein
VPGARGGAHLPAAGCAKRRLPLAIAPAQRSQPFAETVATAKPDAIGIPVALAVPVAEAQALALAESVPAVASLRRGGQRISLGSVEVS